MKTNIIKSLLAWVFLSASFFASAQCEILNRVYPDGSMMYFMEPVNFYWTKSKSLQGCIVTDKENYFLELQPVPFPEKPKGNDLKENLVLILSDGNTYEFKHYDTRYVKNDSVMKMLFLINKKDTEAVLNYEVIEAKIDMMEGEGVRSYVFKLHKSALKEQLACFLKEEENKKKK